MAQRPKPDHLKMATPFHIRFTLEQKARADRMANATGTPISETARDALMEKVERWEQENPALVAAHPLKSNIDPA